MSAAHSLLEVRTSRSGLNDLEAISQWLTALPKLNNHWWHRLLGQEECLSLELYATNQSISFGVVVPTRLKSYLQGLITASYKQALVQDVAYDPLIPFFAPNHAGQAPVLKSATLNWPTTEGWDTTFTFTGSVDPMANIMSILSQLLPEDSVAVQFLVNPHAGSIQVASRVLVSTPDTHRTHLVMDTLKAGFAGLLKVEPLGRTGFKLRPAWPFAQKSLSHQIVARRGWALIPRQLTAATLAKLYHFPDQRLSHLATITWGKVLPGEPPENLPIITSETSATHKKEINTFARAKYKGHMVAYGLQRQDRRRHLYVIGKTGTGKSTLLANMAINDLKNDEGLCVIDPHGDLVESLLNYIPARRINDVIYFDPSDPDRTVKINLFEGENVAHRELIASGIVSVFQKLYSYSWGPRLEYILRNALLTLLKSPSAKLSDILDLLNDPVFRESVVSKLDDPILKNFWVNEFDKLPDKQRTEAIAPILNKVGQFVSSPLIRNVVNTTKSSFSIEDAMNQGKIILVNLSQGRLGEDNATLLGAMLITKIQLAAMSRVDVSEEQRRDFYLYVDEFQNFATDSFVKILSEARKYRLNLTLANQYIAQIPETVQKAIFGNCGSVVSFVMGADDASVFTKEYGDKYTSEDLVSLSRYHILNKISIDNVISAPFPAQTLPLASSTNSNRDKVIKVSRERYATKK